MPWLGSCKKVPTIHSYKECQKSTLSNHVKSLTGQAYALDVVTLSMMEDDVTIALPSTKHVTLVTNLGILLECAKKDTPLAGSSANQPLLKHKLSAPMNHLLFSFSNFLFHGSVTPAPMIKMHVSTCHGQAHLEILPDCGVDICAAGPQFVQTLEKHMENLAPSSICLTSINGSLTPFP